ncbi:MAG: PhoH family protein [Clostridia bacterium]|nr:PhoH family protein [Clostridia bacterium]
MNDRNMSVLEEELSVTAMLRGQELRLSGDAENVALAEEVIGRLLSLLDHGETIDPLRVRYAIQLARSGDAARIEELTSGDIIAFTHRGKPIRCKTLGQRAYVDAVRTHELTLSVGPAGTGKTYLAMCLAVVALKNKEIERIILTRPAVEAGEKLGFLPGDMSQKVDPYLRPLYDALFELMGAEAYQKLQERGTVEVAPLAFMRGRTLSNSFIILDEAQNATPEQMKMFLTRLGPGSRCVVTGDVSQTDLPRDKRSGLSEAVDVLRGVRGVAVAELTVLDVVRHELVQRIVRAYDTYEKNGGRK